MSVLVTGGAGFIGSHLVDELVENGAEVTVVDDLSSGRKSNLKKSIDQIEFIEEDIRNLEEPSIIPQNTSLVFHLAANASVPTSVNNPSYDYEVNSSGTFKLLEQCRKKDIEKIIYSSSAAVYGEPLYTPIDESHPLNPISPYGASKLCGEKMGFAFSNTYGLSFSALRIFNVYGPRQGKYVMHDFAKKLEKNPECLHVLGTGSQKRSFCYISDAIDAFLLLAEKGEEEVFNLAGEDLIKIGDLARLMVSKLSPETKIRYKGESWTGDIQNLVADISKIKQEGFEPKVTLKDGIEKLIEHYRLNKDA